MCRLGRRRNDRPPTSQTHDTHPPTGGPEPLPRDRKSTRLNSSHLVISYAVFCLKKKNHQQTTHREQPQQRPIPILDHRTFPHTDQIRQPLITTISPL